MQHRNICINCPQQQLSTQGVNCQPSSHLKGVLCDVHFSLMLVHLEPSAVNFLSPLCPQGHNTPPYFHIQILPQTQIPQNLKLSIATLSVDESLWYFAQSMAVSLPCSAQNIRVIYQQMCILHTIVYFKICVKDDFTERGSFTLMASSLLP